MSEDCTGGTTAATSGSVVRPTASNAFVRHLLSSVNEDDVCKMIEVQQYMLSRFEKTNEMLLNFNGLSNTRYETTQKEFRQHVQLLVDTKKDLDMIFRRIRSLKSKLSSQYPVAFAACAQVYQVPDDDEEDYKEESGTDLHKQENGETSETPTNTKVKVTVDCVTTKQDPEIPSQAISES